MIEAAYGVGGRGTVVTGRIELSGSPGPHAYFLASTSPVPALTLGGAALLVFGALLVAALSHPPDPRPDPLG